MKQKTFEYHNSLLELLDKKINNKEKLTIADYDEVMQTFSSCVSIQRTMVDLSLEQAKKALTDAFNRCGFDIWKETENEL